MRIFFIYLILIIGLTSVVFADDDPKYPFHPKYTIDFTSSNLPVILIELDTVMAEKEDDERIPASMKIIWDTEGGRNDTTNVDTTNIATIDYDGKIGIKYRGNSSYTLSEKKPFGIRLLNENGKKKNASILGMPADNDWALLAPFNDKSMIRDMLLFELMKGTMDYVPTGRYCELVLNGIYQGVYLMAARVRQGPNRVDIESPTDNQGMGLTGGYHLEIDRDDDPGFWSTIPSRDIFENEVPFYPFYQYKYPDEGDLTPEQIDYIQTYVKKMEQAVAGDNFKDSQKGFRNYIDDVSVMNYYIAQEFSRNVDGYRLSTPLYKYPDSIDQRFKFSIWDFNISFGNANYRSSWSSEGWAFNGNQYIDECRIPWMFKRMLQDDIFYGDLKKLWNTYRNSRLSNDSIIHKIDSLTNLLSESQARNESVWKCFGRDIWPNYYIARDWDDEILFLKDWILNRLAWIDQQWDINNREINIVANTGFEASVQRGILNATWLSDWHSTGNVFLNTNEPLTGTYALSMKDSSNIKQFCTEVPGGRYHLKAWVKTESDPGASVYIKYYNDRSGEDEVRLPIEDIQDYHLIEIKNIDVQNNFLEIGFETATDNSNAYLLVDDIILTKQPDDNHIAQTLPEADNPRIVVDKIFNEIRLYFTSSAFINTDLTVYTIAGRQVLSKKITSDEMIIRDKLMPGQVYILKIGNISRKILY
ncbi:MAG: CotH kinase family protein [Tannerella sp.]|jgi:hypothetical protein|nr:CotH kinase family protein [Tannerella sp.]